MSDKTRENPTEFEGEDTLEIQHSEEIYPNAIVKISKLTYSVFELKRKLESKDRQDIILNPDFQRGPVWTMDKQRSELVESLLMGIPIPIIYLFENREGKKEVVDGRQRIITIMDYLNNQFPLSMLRILHHLNGNKFTDLDPKLQSYLEDYQIATYVIQPPTPEIVKFDIFDRVNRGGTRLNNQEMRNALYQGKCTDLLEKLSKLEVFKKVTGDSIKPTRMKDRYIILRFIAFYLQRQGRIIIDYTSDIDDFLAKTMSAVNAFTDEEIQSLENIFAHVMQQAYDILGTNCFRFRTYNQNRRPVNMALFEVLSYFFTIADIVCYDKSKIKEKINTVKEAFDKSGAFSTKVDSHKSIAYRFEQVEALKESL